MAKISLGTRPKNFKHIARVPMHDGTTGTIEVLYTYRTRSEFGALVDELLQAAKVTPASADEADIQFSMQAAMERTREGNADYLMRILEGWNLDTDFSRTAVAQLCDQLPGAALALINDYRDAITEGRLGN